MAQDAEKALVPAGRGKRDRTVGEGGAEIRELNRPGKCAGSNEVRSAVELECLEHIARSEGDWIAGEEKGARRVAGAVVVVKPDRGGDITLHGRSAVVVIKIEPA